MTSINRLPKEVLQQVFSFVGDKDSLMNCSIVCKKWRESATQEIYEDLTLEAYHNYKLKKLFEKNDPKQDVYFKQLHWTKKLKIKEDNLYSLKSQMIKLGGDLTAADMLEDKCKLEQKEFEKFMSYIPKLEKFNIKETRNKSHYSTLLCNIDSATYLKRLEQICGLTLEACYNCYATLTHLVFSYSENATITIDGEEKDLPGLLPNFECLTHLWFWTGSQEVTMTDLSLLCPKLLSLAFYRDHIDISEESLNKTLAKMDEQKQVVNTINQNIKELDLHLSNLSSKYINLITKYSATHLGSLSITLNGVTMYDWIGQVTWDSTLKLTELMRAIPNASIIFEVKEHRGSASSIRHETTMTRFYNLLDALTLGRPTLYHTIEATDSQSKLTTSIRIKNNKQVTSLYGLGSEEYGEYRITRDDGHAEEETRGAYIQRISDVFELPLPDIEKSLIGPEVINNWSFLTTRSYPSIPYRLLKYVLINCPHLQFVDLYCTGTHQRIVLSSGEKICQQSQAHSSHPSISSQEYLKYVRFEGLPPTQEYLDLISSHSPAVESFICVDNTFNSYYNQAARQPTRFTFNLTAFKQLKLLYMSIQAALQINTTTTDPVHSLFIHFKYGNGEEAYYRVHGRNYLPYELSTTTQQFV